MFFERYQIGDINSIQQRFSKTKDNLLNIQQITGIYMYLNFLVEKQIEQGPYGNDSDYE